jgi:hypothetical protein
MDCILQGIVLLQYCPAGLSTQNIRNSLCVTPSAGVYVLQVLFDYSATLLLGSQSGLCRVISSFWRFLKLDEGRDLCNSVASLWSEGIGIPALVRTILRCRLCVEERTRNRWQQVRHPSCPTLPTQSCHPRRGRGLALFTHLLSILAPS